MLTLKKLSKMAITLCVLSALVFLPEKAHSVAGIAVTVDDATGFIATITTDATAVGGFIQAGTIFLRVADVVSDATIFTQDLSHLRVFLTKTADLVTANEGFPTTIPAGARLSAASYDRVTAVIYGLPGESAEGVEAIRLPVVIDRYKQAFDIDVRGYSAFNIRFNFQEIYTPGFKLWGKRIDLR